MEFYYCWPYEELTVTKLEETRAFRFELPWYASIVKTSAEGSQLFEKLFAASPEFSQEELLEAYKLALSPTLHEPYAYILPMQPAGTPNFIRSSGALPASAAFSTPQTFAEFFKLKNFPARAEWTWDIEAVLQMSQVPGTDLHSPLTVYSVFRRFFYLEALEKDQTKRLYRDLPGLCKSEEHLKNALAYVLMQNLHVTQKCDEALKAALPFSGNNREALKEFADAERGHDKIMERALEAIPGRLPWSQAAHPTTRFMMDLFTRTAENNFFAFAFAICLFERPQLEEVHPLTQLLKNHGLQEAAKRYEVHHKINEAGDHDHIGFEMIQRIPLLTGEEVIQATRWAEAMSCAMTSHSADLLQEISLHPA